MEARYIQSLTSPKIPGFEWQEPEDDYDRKLFRHVLTQGCAILPIIPSENHPELPGDFIYTIGFYLNLQHPEILMLGSVSDAAADTMSSLFDYVESGKRIEDGHTVRYDLGKGEKRLVARLVPQERYFDYLGYGSWFYRSLLWKVEPIAVHKWPVLQLVWPDPNGFYPWDDDCNPRAREIQTLVELPDTEAEK